MIIKRPGQRCPDSRDLLEIGHPGTQHAGQTPEVHQQCPAARRAQPRHGLEYRFLKTASAAAPVPGDRKAVRLIADPLQQVEDGTVGRHGTRHRVAGQMEPLLPGSPVGSLGNAQQRQAMALRARQPLLRGTELPRAAVDQQQVRAWQVAGDDPRAVPGQRLFERGIVVAGRHAFDVVAPVGALMRPLLPKHHAAGHGALATRVADVKAIDALGHAWQRKGCGEPLE